MNLRRAAGNAGILQGLNALLVLTVYMVLYKAAGLDMQDFGDPQKLAAFQLGHPGVAKLGWTTDIIFSLTTIILSFGFYRRLRKSQPERGALQAITAVIASALFVAAGGIGTMAVSDLAGKYASNAAEAVNAFYPISIVQFTVENCAVFFASVSLWFVARGAHAAGILPKSVVYLGYFAALGALGLPLTIIDPMLGMLTLPTVLGVAGFSFGIGMNFLRKPVERTEAELAVAH